MQRRARARNLMTRAVPGGHVVAFDYSYQTRRIADPGSTIEGGI